VWSRVAAAGLVIVIVAVCGFALWASQLTAAATGRATTANRLSADFADAARAIETEEELEGAYRLAPNDELRAGRMAAAHQLVNALDRVRAEGTTADRRDADAVQRMHAAYLSASERLFDAVDRRDGGHVEVLDRTEANPTFHDLQATIDRALDAHRARSLAELTSLRRLSSVLDQGVPLVFTMGLTIAVLCVSVLRRYRRDLDAERRQAVHDSLHDSLTGLANRQLLADRLDAAVRDGTRVGLILLDLDRFKEINDALGHSWGDVLLSRIGPRLVATVRATDTVARLGGDEFAVLVPAAGSLADVIAVAEKLRQAAEVPVQIAGAELIVEASAGIVISGEHGDTAPVLLQHAEVAMYVAKDRKRGLAVYEPSEDSHDASRLALLAELRRGIDNNELVLYYQPKESLVTGQICGVEALVRWEHPRLGLLAPDEFIPLAEHTAIIGPLTHHVLDAAVRQARTWRDAGHPLPVAVNVAARNLADPHLADIILDLLATHEVPPPLLCLELTESAITTDPDRALRLMTRLRAAGVSLAVDDFGTGYTSLAQLGNLPITELKIDRSFVDTMTTDRSNDLIVRSIVDLGRNLGMTTVAEGVEDAETLAALAGYGCAVIQGFHLSGPLPVDAFDRWYARRRADRKGALLPLSAV
jgi:diguanylate cyclase (GGDEF)-like protein